MVPPTPFSQSHINIALLITLVEITNVKGAPDPSVPVAAALWWGGRVDSSTDDKLWSWSTLLHVTSGGPDGSKTHFWSVWKASQEFTVEDGVLRRHWGKGKLACAPARSRGFQCCFCSHRRPRQAANFSLALIWYCDYCWRVRLHLAPPSPGSMWLCKVTQTENGLWSTRGPMLNTVDLDSERGL